MPRPKLENTEETVLITFKTTVSLKKEILRLAAMDDRSQSGMVRRLLEWGIPLYEKQYFGEDEE